MEACYGCGSGLPKLCHRSEGEAQDSTAEMWHVRVASAQLIAGDVSADVACGSAVNSQSTMV